MWGSDTIPHSIGEPRLQNGRLPWWCHATGTMAEPIILPRTPPIRIPEDTKLRGLQNVICSSGILLEHVT